MPDQVDPNLNSNLYCAGTAAVLMTLFLLKCNPMYELSQRMYTPGGVWSLDI